MEFGEFLRMKREAKRMTIRQLAMYAGCSAGYISMLERGVVGQRGPSPAFLRKLFSALGVPYEVLMAAAGYQLQTDDEVLYPGSLVRVLRESMGECIEDFAEQLNMTPFEVDVLEKQGVSYETLSEILKLLFAKYGRLSSEQKEVVRSLEETFYRLPSAKATQITKLVFNLLELVGD